ncbi:MAG: rhamnogalacturonan lyase [Opitutaceae bacterium]|nr:rhamnogalacturonan lyase [Opitutaceae bacterium]
MAVAPLHAQRVMEKLDRGVVAIHQPDGRVWVSWRLLASDPIGIGFNVYRLTGGATDREEIGIYGARQTADAGAVKINAEPLTGPTWCIDDRPNLARETRYEVRVVIDGQERPADGSFTIAAGALPLPYLSIPLQTPAGYTPNDASAADLDGDGRYEIVLHQTGVGRDNSQAGVTDAPVFQAYTLDGKLLWTINLGKNVREGAHYTQFMVYDLDGDGRAEFACKTADGTVDGVGKVIGDPAADWVEKGAETVPTADRSGAVTDAEGRMRARLEGRILRGPEYLTVFDGRTGAALATVPYVPQRFPGNDNPTGEQMKELWGDAYANRMDRFLACVAYLDGKLPSLVMCRGYYTRAVLAAWDFRDGKLTQRWVFDSLASEDNKAYSGQGFHNLSVADVDADGRDEIVHGACVIDDDGTGLYSTGWGHGDALHVSDLVPSNPGLEVLGIQERFDRQGINMRDAATGRPIFLVPSVKAADSGGDKGEGPGRGVAFNVDPRYPGSEVWAAGAGMNGMFSATGERISEKRPRSANFAIWWDGDFLRELLDRNVITKWNWNDSTETVLLVAQDCSSNNGTKATPALSADLLGDWREEVLLRTLDGKALRLYTTTIPTKHRLVTLMQDPQYRLAIAWQNVAYNQPPHPSFALDEPQPK